MWKILVTPDRAGRRVGEVHISRKSHDEMLNELLTHPVRPLPIIKVTACLKDRVATIGEAHEIVRTFADAFWICWCDDPSQYSAPDRPHSLFAR